MKLALMVVSAACVIAASGGVAGADEDPRGPEPPVFVFMPPAPEPAPLEPAPEPGAASEEEKLSDGGAALTFGTLFFQPSLGGKLFEGAGTPLGGTGRESFRHTGRELGVDSPLMWGGELSLHYMRRYFAVGVMGFVAGHPGRADSGTPASSLAAEQVNPGALTGYGGGIDLAGALPLGPVAFRAGAVLGLRGFSMPMTGFESKTCHRKRENYPCHEDATTDALLFFEPRVRMEISPGASGVFFGGYVGMEVIGGTGPTTGFFVGLATPHATLQP